jgi:ketosteroid isomerase-like protein
MKKLLLILPLVFLLSIFLIESKPTHAEEWTADQKEIVDWFKKYVEVCFEGGADKVMRFFHPEYIEWDFGQEAPIGYEEKKEGEESFYDQNYKLTSFDVEPLKIQIKGNYAIAHLYFDMTYKDSEGKASTTSGPWTAVLIKENDKWLFLSNSYTDK